MVFSVYRGEDLISSIPLIRNPNIPNPTASFQLYPGAYIVRARAYGTDTPSATSPVLASGAASFVVARGVDQSLDIELKPVRPEVQQFLPTNAGIGEQVTILGDGFGASEGKPIQVTLFPGIAVSAVTRLDDSTLRVMVPAGAKSGDLTVTVGAYSTIVPFTILESLALAGRSVDVALGRSMQLEAMATDTDQRSVAPAARWDLLVGKGVDLGVGATTGTNSITITGLALGKATVRARSGALQATCSVNVFKVNGVSLAPTSLVLNAMPEDGDPEPAFATSGLLDADVISSDGKPRAVTWSSSNEALVTVVDGLVRTTRGAVDGTVIITARSMDDPSHFATASVQVTTDGKISVGVN